MEESVSRINALEKRVEYLSVQVERLIELQSPFPSLFQPFRKAAMMCSITFEQEVLTRKLLGAIHALNDGKSVDINEGLLPFPKETVTLFNQYAASGRIDRGDVKSLLKTIVPGGDEVVQRLLEAWEAVQSEIRCRDGK